MLADRLLLGPNAAPPAPDRHGTTRNRLPRSAAPGCRPWPRAASTARPQRKTPPHLASPPPSADPADRIINRPELRGSWRCPPCGRTRRSARLGILLLRPRLTADRAHFVNYVQR